MIIAIVLILVVIIVLLMVYNISIHNKIQNFTNLNQKIANLNILQDFMDTISKTTYVDEKIKRINDILIERYEIKYSTIVVYDGAEYVVKASNVDQRHWDTLRNLHNEPIFKESIQKAIPKYITIDNENERLPYQKMEFGRAKSAMFFPLFIDNVYIGYWIIEGNKPHEFDNVDVTILEVVKNNIVSVLRTLETQQVIENTVRDDKFSKLKSAEYLFGEGKKIINRYTTSTVCLFKITNLEDINKEINRETGNEIIKQVAEVTKESLSSEYIFVRYMGPKFAIVFSGIELDAVNDFMKILKENIEELKIPAVDLDEEDVEEDELYATPKINAVISTYYKGTALEKLTKVMEEYLDNADPDENKINFI